MRYTLNNTHNTLYCLFKVTVHVRNLMDTLEMTLHFHGMFMQGSTWFDGVPDLSQTPIWPGQSFTYRFEATPSGTHWYHTHVPGTHVHGLYGLFIVHRRGPPLPPPVAELHMLVSDFWGREALVNGRGSQDGRPFPLATFHVQPGKAHLLRVVNSGDETPVKITIDNHLLRVVALDGVDVEPMEVDAVIMHVAERIDIELDANQNPEKYWIRIEAVPGDRKFQGGLAILEYSGAQVLSAPRSRRQECTSSRPCLVFNCLREAYPPNQFLRCINLHEARTAHAPDFQNKFALADPVDEEYFLSVQRTFGDSSINYVIFSPLSGAFFDPNNSFVECNQRSCQGYNSCRCTQVIPLRFNRTINLVIFSRDLYMAEALHPMHTHGHHMAVLAYGYPKIDTTTGRIQEFSRDIACESDFCVNPRWANGRPPVNLVNPPLKDTIAFPAGGYVIARIRSDNPGVWLFHCHITDHVRRGMRLIFEEAAERRPEPPSERPTWD